MTMFFNRLYHFLGGIYFAIILIASTALFVISGTLIESSTDSHLHAASYTYGNPIFQLLLWLFFINILFAALRRWPFKPRHVPFLLTHLGLLMILAGALVKSYFGTQGNLSILEGSSSNQLLLPNSYALLVDKKTEREILPFKGSRLQSSHLFPDLTIEVIGWKAHCHEELQAWVKDGRVSIYGLPKVLLTSHLAGSGSPIPSTVSPPWLLYACETDDLSAALKTVYLDKASLPSATALDLHYSTILGMERALLNGIVPLDGPGALLNKEGIDIQMPSKLLIAKDMHGDVTLFYISSAGEIHAETFRSDNLSSIYILEGGTQGYGVSSKVPLHLLASSRKALEKALAQRQKLLLEEALKDPSTLPFPINALNNAAEASGIAFSDFWLAFLKQWDSTQTWFYPADLPLAKQAEKVIDKIDPGFLPQTWLNGCQWASRFFQVVDHEWDRSEDLRLFLKKRNWPLLGKLEQESADTSEQEVLLTLLTEQLFQIGEQVAPPLVKPFSQMGTSEKAHILSILLRLQGIETAPDWTIDSLEERAALLQNEKTSELLSPINRKLTALPALDKWEDNRPLLTLKISQGNRQEIVQLAYDPSASSLKWPVLGGEYLLRFQPLSETIPYEVRLRDTRQINYPNSSQPYSYESDLVFTKSGQSVEKTISMNHVHETEEGYRFYMANLTPTDESSAQRAQIAVNFDPGKYLLTYTGAFILTTGIILLFWILPKRKRSAK
jgi:hypothetical protein